MVSGTQIIVATVWGNVPIRKMEFRVTGGTRRDAVIGTATFSRNIAYVQWNTKSVPNGHYSVQSILYFGTGKIGRSRAITVVVAN
jgi:hypothetical protein